MISLVVARDRNGAIGRGGTIPWHIPEDLRFFQRETLGGAVIMGRRTWESLPAFARPLKNRLNIVVASGAVTGADHVVASVDAAIDTAHAAGHARVAGIGGAGIYRTLMPLAHRLRISEVDLAVADADTWFPDFDESDWRVTARLVLREAGPRCELVEWMRRIG